MIIAYVLFGLSALSAVLLWSACAVSGRADDDADDYAELAAFWPDMQGLPDGIDIFEEKYGKPTGKEQ